MKHNDEANRCQEQTPLVLIATTQPEKSVTVQQMFEEMARREAEMIREARERATKRIG